MRAVVAIALMALALPVGAATESTSHAMTEPMSPDRMAEIMQMDDTAQFGRVLFDRLEWRDAGAQQGRMEWDGQGWYGGDYNKLWVKTEGTYVTRGHEQGARDADVEILWNRVISRWWNVQVGGRQDAGPEQARTWGAIGIQGLAPQWFESEATLYVSDGGRTAARLKAQYDLLLTQRLVLQPLAEMNLYGHTDAQRHIGSGVSSLEVGVRLRYELRREFAPYIGFVWLRHFGETADLIRAAGGKADDLELALGLRVWF